MLRKIVIPYFIIASGYDNQGDKENVDALLDISIAANSELYYRIREEHNMNEVTREFFKEEFEKAEQKGREEGEAKRKELEAEISSLKEEIKKLKLASL